LKVDLRNTPLAHSTFVWYIAFVTKEVCMIRHRLRTFVVAAAFGLLAAGAEFVVPSLPAIVPATPLAQAVVALMPSEGSVVYAVDNGQSGSRKARGRRSCGCSGSP
jgi:hypothetical protein